MNIFQVISAVLMLVAVGVFGYVANMFLGPLVAILVGVMIFAGWLVPTIVMANRGGSTNVTGQQRQSKGATGRDSR